MPYDYKAKTRNINQLNKYMLAKTLSMFEYQGLPETIPQRELERLLQTNGYAFITKCARWGIIRFLWFVRRYGARPIRATDTNHNR